jgi:hypothetical protein
VLTVFALYLNVPAILTKFHGLPEVAAGAFIAALGVPLLHVIFVQRKRFRADASFWLMLAFLGVCAVSTPLAKDTGIAMNYIRRYLLEGVLIYWLVTNVIRTLPDLRRVILTLLAAGALLSALNVFQELTKTYSRDFGGLAYRPPVEVTEMMIDRDGPVKDKHLRAERAHGPMLEPNRFAQILIVLLPFAIYVARSSSRRLTRLFAVGSGALILAAILVTFSRAAFLVLGMVAIAAMFMRWIRPRYVLASVLALIIATPIVAPHMIKRLGSISAASALVASDPAEAEMDGAMKGRATTMLAAFNAFRDHPWLGVGPGQYSPMYSAYYHDIGPQFREMDTKRAHILYFEVAAETGIVGLTVFMSIVLLLVRDLWKARVRLRGRSDELVDLATAGVLAILCYLGTAVFLHLTYARYYWLLLAVASASLQVIRSHESQARLT